MSEELEKQYKEGKLEIELKDLRRLYAIWKEMNERHMKIYHGIIVSQPQKKELVENAIEKANRITEKFLSDINEIEAFLAKKKQQQESQS